MENRNTNTEDRKMEDERQDFFYVWGKRGYPTRVCRGYFPREVTKPHDGMLVFIEGSSSNGNLEEAVRTLYNLGVRFSWVWFSDEKLRVYYDVIPGWIEEYSGRFRLAGFRKIEFVMRKGARHE